MPWSLYIWSDGEISFDNSPRPLGDKGGTAKRLVRDSLVLQGENNPSPPVSPYPLPSERAVINCGPAVNPNVEARDPPERRGAGTTDAGRPAACSPQASLGVRRLDAAFTVHRARRFFSNRCWAHIGERTARQAGLKGCERTEAVQQKGGTIRRRQAAAVQEGRRPQVYKLRDHLPQGEGCPASGNGSGRSKEPIFERPSIL